MKWPCIRFKMRWRSNKCGCSFHELSSALDHCRGSNMTSQNMPLCDKGYFKLKAQEPADTAGSLPGASLSLTKSRNFWEMRTAQSLLSLQKFYSHQGAKKSVLRWTWTNKSYPISIPCIFTSPQIAALRNLKRLHLCLISSLQMC